MQEESATDLNDLICDLLFYQYIIKTSVGTSSENKEDSVANTENAEHSEKEDTMDSSHNDSSQTSVYAYEKYKDLLRRVLDIVQKNDTRLQEASDEHSVQEALAQLRIIKRDVLMVEKATLINIGKASGMHTVASKIDMLQRTLMKAQNTSSRNKKKLTSKKDTDEGGDDSDGYVSLEDKSAEEEDASSGEETVDAEQDLAQPDDKKDTDDSEEEETDKIIPIEGPLPKAFVANNDISPPPENTDANSPAENPTEKTEPIEYFHKTKDWGWLSSFHTGLFYYKDRRYRTVEHAFHAQKSDDVEYQGPFSMDSPAYIGDAALAAKHRGSKKSFESSSFVLRTDWDDVRVRIMRECVEAFYAAHPELGDKLVKTLPAPLHHTGYKVGTFWGMQKGKGENQHGKILMALRDTLANQRANKKDGETKTSTWMWIHDNPYFKWHNLPNSIATRRSIYPCLAHSANRCPLSRL